MIKKDPNDKEPQILEGTLKLHHRGFGFFQPDEKKLKKSIFIPKHLTLGAVDGDRVKVEISEIESEKGPEGKVIQVLQRNHSQLVGTLMTPLPKGEWLVHIPLLGAASPLRMMATTACKLAIGHRVVVQVKRWGGPNEESIGVFDRFIGPIADPSKDIPTFIAAYELNETFPQKVEQEAKEYGNRVANQEMQGREDLRKLECFTIDPDTAKDFDDALSLYRGKEGNFHLGVHIADVSHYVKPGTALDNEARIRCNSIYFPGGVLPMLPHALSSELCSLKPRVPRLTISVFMIFDPQGHLKNYRIARSVIKSQERFTYHQAKEVLDGKRESKHAKTLALMVELCQKLKERRGDRGSLELNVPQLSVKVDKQGYPLSIDIEEYDVTHQMVEEFMLKANEIVATHLAKEGKSLTFRIHEAPSSDKIKDFALFVRMLGFDLPTNPTAADLQALFDQVRALPAGEYITTAFIRSMKLASYSVENIGHFGLGLEHYTHFTSPIRRYIDLIIHRLLFNEVKADEDLEEIAANCSEQEQNASKAENECILLKKLRYLLSQRETRPKITYDAIITHVKPNGIVFNIPEILLEGYMPLSKLEEDFFVYQEKRQSLKGSRSGALYRAGDLIVVAPERIDLIMLETRWWLVEKKGEGKKREKKRKKKTFR